MSATLRSAGERSWSTRCRRETMSIAAGLRLREVECLAEPVSFTFSGAPVSWVKQNYMVWQCGQQAAHPVSQNGLSRLRCKRMLNCAILLRFTWFEARKRHYTALDKPIAQL